MRFHTVLPGALIGLAALTAAAPIIEKREDNAVAAEHLPANREHWPGEPYRETVRPGAPRPGRGPGTSPWHDQYGGPRNGHSWGKRDGNYYAPGHNAGWTEAGQEEQWGRAGWGNRAPATRPYRPWGKRDSINKINEHDDDSVKNKYDGKERNEKYTIPIHFGNDNELDGNQLVAPYYLGNGHDGRDNPIYVPNRHFGKRQAPPAPGQPQPQPQQHQGPGQPQPQPQQHPAPGLPQPQPQQHPAPGQPQPPAPADPNGNVGPDNVGYDNRGANNAGVHNNGVDNQGTGNSGYGNTGQGNSGINNTGTGNSGSTNTGVGNSGAVNTGAGNSGASNSGYGNSGVGNTGVGQSGYGPNAPRV